MKTIRKIIRVDRREIYFLKFILEAYDGIAAMTTVDARLGIVLLRIAPGCKEEVETVIHDLGRDILIEPFDEHTDTMMDPCDWEI